MKHYNFSLGYLGGPVDLWKLRGHLAPYYSGLNLEIARGIQVLNIPLLSSTVKQDGREIDVQLTCHQFASGFGSLVAWLDDRDGPQRLTLEEAQALVLGPELSLAVMSFFHRVFDTQDLGELFSKLKDPMHRRQFRQTAGVEILVAGLDQCHLGLHGFNCYWTVGSEVEKRGWVDLTAGQELIWAGDNNRFWSAGENQDLYWDMVTILYREHVSSCYLEYVRGWLGSLSQQLKQTRESLRQSNEELWTQDRDEVELMDLNFLSFNIQCQETLSTLDHLYRREAPPAALRMVEPGQWESLSRYGRRRLLINDLLSECRYAIERMTRPLDFREFRLLKSGVEEVEARIMLLTVLLVIMELFALTLEPGHWYFKGILLLLLVAIPGTFIVWSRHRRSRARRQGRLHYLKNLRAKSEEEARAYQQQMDELRSVPNLTSAARDYYQRLYGEMLKRIAAKIKGIDQEIGRLRGGGF